MLFQHVPDPAPYLLGDPLLFLARPARMFFKGAFDLTDKVILYLLRIVHVKEPYALDNGAGSEAELTVKDKGHHNYAFLGDLQPLLEEAVLHLAQDHAVDQDITRRGGPPSHLGPVAVEA